MLERGGVVINEKHKKERIGETIKNNQGIKMKIIEYRSANDIDIQFEDGTIVKNNTYQNFAKGQIKNPNYPSVYDIGFIGIGSYKSRENKKQTKQYIKWVSMMNRCYSIKFMEKWKTYEKCEVCKEWHNFQNFAKWYDENFWNEDCNCLDKDILIKGNKIYSPETCIFVDSKINSLFLKSNNSRGDFPIGVSYDKKQNNYYAHCRTGINGERIQNYFGGFETKTEAFQTYKEFKEEYIKQIADEYKEKYENFPQKLYEAMINYKVEVTD